MKVNMLFASIALCLAIHCFGGSKISSDTQPQKSVIQSKDTVVNVSERFAILYKKYDKETDCPAYKDFLSKKG